MNRSKKFFFIFWAHIFAILFILLLVDYNLNYVYFLPTPYKFFQSIPSHLREASSSSSSSVKVNGCIFVLLRNRNLIKFAKTMTQFEKMFNQYYNYPYVLVNNEEFSDEFKQTITKYTKSKVEFGLIPKEEWSIPAWINREKLGASLENIPFSINYHYMCRYFSGFFFRHELTLKYDYFWRIDYDSNFPCPIREDPFEVMIKNNKTYGFVLGDGESFYTMPSLWMVVKEWLNSGYKNLTPVNNALQFLSDNNGESLTSTCIFYNNFEIASFELFRSDLYLAYFDFLDKDGGLFYERWGDAPIHTYFVSLMLNKSQVHLFKDIPYSHQHGINYKFDQNGQCQMIIDGCNSHWLKKTQLN